MSQNQSADKSLLRGQFIHQRQALSKEVWQSKSNLLCKQLLSQDLFLKAHTILAYFSFRQEPNLKLLFDNNKNWAFPRCIGNFLEWHIWYPGADYQNGRYGIQEPLSSAPKLDPSVADLILVPAVACANSGLRLGYGGGYYDRFLSASEINTIPSIGIVFDFAFVAQLPADPWDCKLDFVVTENQFYSCLS